MGKTYSCIAEEQKTWLEHDLHFNQTTREANKPILTIIKDGTDIYLTHIASQWGGIEFQHWFVTDKSYFIEFGSANSDIYKAEVTITTGHHCDFPLDKEASWTCKMTEEIRNRIGHVLGMTNYSLCLRNSEHVANYIFRGRWMSTQMDEEGFLMKFFSTALSEKKTLVNSFPSEIRPHLFKDGENDKLYSFIDGHFTATSFDYYLDKEDKTTYNILVIGPTGAGKSHLINVFFNQKICESSESHASVTKEIYFIRGTGQIYITDQNGCVERDILVADTIGLCDTDWDDSTIINLIKSRVSSNFKEIDVVLMVFKADRLSKAHVENIQCILKWLGYENGKNRKRFKFVATFAEYMEADRKELMRKQAIKMLGLEKFVEDDGVFATLVYTGFPPEKALNDKTKDDVQESWRTLKMIIENPGSTERIPVGQQGSSCTIL